MRSVSVRLEDLQKVTIPIGFVGENLHTKVLIDCKKVLEEYPTAVVSLTVKPPEGDAYPVTVVRNGDIVEWTVSNSNLIYDGNGEMQLTFIVDEVVAKSFIGKIRVVRSIVGSGEVPTPIEDWMTQANETLEAVEVALVEIPETVDEAVAEALEGKADKNNTVLTNSVSMGRASISNRGASSVALGGSVSALSEYSTAIGHETTADGNSSFAFGSYNADNEAISTWQANTQYKKGDLVRVVYQTQYLRFYRCINPHTSRTSLYSDEDKWKLIWTGSVLNNTYKIPKKLIEQVGNGSNLAVESSRSNARALDWAGNEYLAGDVYVGCNDDSTGGEKLAKVSELPDISGKADKVGSATEGNFAGLDANGNLTDSGKKPSDFLTQHQDISGKADKTDTVLNTTLSRGRASNTTVGESSMAFGRDVTASAQQSVAFGESTNAVNTNSFAHGNYTEAFGTNSHAEGDHTIAAAPCQHVSGRYNVRDTAVLGKYYEIVGNGTGDNSRSNAYALEYNGTAHFKGDVYVGCNDNSTGGSKLAKVSEVNDLMSAINILEPSASASDVGKALILKTVSGGKATSYEYGEAGGAEIDDTAGEGDTDKVWSADKTYSLEETVEGYVTNLSGKVSKPSSSPNGTSGQILKTNGDGTTTWINAPVATTQQIEDAVDAWLDDHPDATTTVQDGAITLPKLNSSLADNIVITDETEKTYYHNVAPTSVKVYPNTYTQTIAVRYAGSQNLVDASDIDSGDYSGLTRTKDGRFVKVTGTSTGGFQLFNSTNSTFLSKFAGKTVTLCMYLSKATGFAASSYLALRVNNATNVKRVNFDTTGSDIIGWHTWDNIEIPSELTQLRFYFNSLSGSTFSQGDFIWIGIYETTPVITETIATTDPAEISVSGLTKIDTMMHESTVETIVPTKQYVDEHTPDIIGFWSDNIYALPEDFGAKGDGTTDDATALADCISYAKTSGKPVRGYGKYKTSSSIVLDNADLDVYLKSIIYTGNSTAVQISCTDIRFDFHSITSSAKGIEFKKISGKSCLRNVINGSSITSDGDCIYCGEYTYYGTLDIRYLNSNNGNCIEFEVGNPVTEYVFRSCSCRCPNGYVAYYPVDSKFYDFTVEANCKYGLMNPDGCVCIGWRHREQIDSIARQIEGSLSTTNGGLIITGTTHKNSMFKYIASDGMYWYSIDTSLTKGYGVISGTGATDIWNNMALFNYEIDVPVRGSGQITGATNPYEMIGKKAYIVGGNKVFVPYGRRTITISSATYDYRLFDSMTDTDIVSCSTMHWGTDFIIDVAETAIYFHASHCAIGYNDLTVTQENGNFATIYDKQGNVLFDGQTLGDGKFSLKCIMDSDSTGRLSGTTAWWSYDGTNEKWEITKIE